MKTDNEIIAEFMGIVVYQTYEEMQAVPIDQLKPWILPEQCTYHESWGSIMPVVEKINASPLAPSIEIGRAMVLFDTGESADSFYISDHGGLLGATYQAVLRYLKWHEGWKAHTLNMKS